MVYQELQDINITGFDDVLVYISTQLPFFVPMMLLFIWMMFTLLMYFGSRKFSGQADFFSAAAAGGFVSVVLATILSLYSGITNMYTLILMTVIVILSFVFLWVRRNRD